MELGPDTNSELAFKKWFDLAMRLQAEDYQPAEDLPF